MQKIVKARFLCTERKFKTMSQHLLDIENLTVAVEDKEILHGVNLLVLFVQQPTTVIRVRISIAPALPK